MASHKVWTGSYARRNSTTGDLEIFKPGDMVPFPDGVVPTAQCFRAPVESASVPRSRGPKGHLDENKKLVIEQPETPAVEAPDATGAGDDDIVDLNRIHELSIPDVAGLLANVTKLSDVDALEATERENPRHEGGRKGVLDLLTKRRLELS